MQIHELKIGKKKSRKRVGRGGKRGTYSGRGMKGQKARSGGNVDPLFEGGKTSLIERLKKLRGFKSIHRKKNVFNLNDLEKHFDDGAEIMVSSFVKKELLRKSKAKAGVKILGNGKITKKFTVKNNILVSKSAKEAIENAGGKVEPAKKEKSTKKVKPVKKVKSTK